jgi:TonB-linked SusC/RagA family outer membrane protein
VSRILVRTALALAGLALVITGADAQQRTISGTVLDSLTSQPVAQATVQIRGTDLGALTESDGDFVIRGAPSGEISLRIRRIGFTNTTVTVPADQSQVTIRLQPSYLELGELVVTGRATQARRQNVATSVTSVQGEEVQETSQQAVDKALQGRVAGATISQNSGAPGGGTQVQLRGPSSIFARSAPLYVIDGVLVSDDAVAPNANAITSAATGSNPSLDQDNQQNRIADLNPEDIESIEVLKGPAAAAIYGQKAANGVIIIETKRGSAGGPSWRVSARGGFPDNSEKLGARKFETRQEAVDAFGDFAGDVWDENLQAQGGGDFPFFDNEQFLADRNDLSWEASASLSGGGQEGVQYYASAFSKDETGIIDNTGFEKQSLRLNLTRDFGDRFNIGFNSNLIRTRAQRGLTNNDNSQTSYYMVLTATPSFIDLRQNPDGTWPFNPFAGGGSNPLQTASLLEKQEEVFRLIASTNFDASLVEGDRHSFRLVGSAGIDWFAQDNDIFSPPELFFEDNDGLLGTKVVNNADNLQHNTNVNAVWDYRPNEGTTFTTSFGAQFEFSELKQDNVVGQNLTGGKDKVDAGTVISIRANKQKTEDFGFYIQEQVLTLDERLQLTGAVRFDQSSANSDNDELFIFPHASASFRFPDLGGFADELKLRAAFGQTGNRPLFGQEFTSLRVTENIEGIPGFTIEGDVAAEDLQPERQTEIEGGFDLQAFSGRMNLETTAYWQRIDEVILQRTLAPSSGFDTRLFNGGQLENQGLEVSLDGAIIQSADFGWNSRVNFGLNRNEVTDLPVTPFTQGGFGETLGTFCVDDGSSLNDIVGTNPNLSAEETDQCGLDKLGRATPDFNLNFSHDIQWKGFRLFQLWDWRPNFDVINLTELLADAAGVSADFEDADGEVSPVTECFPDCSGLERIVGFANGFARGYVQSASFIKLREASLSWRVPDGVMRSIWGGFDSMRFTLSGRNLFTATPYRGLDPEVSNFGRENFARNVDVAPFPPSRVFWFGTEVSF